MGCAAWSMGGHQAVGESKSFPWISGHGFVPSLRAQVPLRRKKRHCVADTGKREHYLGNLVMQSSIVQQVPPLVWLWHLNQPAPAFLSISKPTGTAFGKRVTSVTLACAEELCGSLCPTADGFIYKRGAITCHSLWKQRQCDEGELCLGWKRGKCWFKNRSSA